MPAVFVHGVPETPLVWDEVLARMSRDDTVALALPGFGNPLPAGFEATKDRYVDWLIAELESIGEPVDLVGHDWGGGFTIRLVSLRPDLVRTWVSDAAGLGDAEFEWHTFAKVWQTPGEGESFMDGQLALSADDRAGVLESVGMSRAGALANARAFDRTMADAILTLYRSATKVNEEWGPDFESIPKPGLVLIPTEDPFLNEACARRSAERAGAELADFTGVGHWWMLSHPDEGARTLEEFWARAAARP